MKSNTRLILLNITGCILFLALPLLFAPGSSGFMRELTSPPTFKDIIAYSLMIGYFYFNFFVLIPSLYLKKQYLLFGIITVACFALVTALPNFLISDKPPFKQHQATEFSKGDKKESTPYEKSYADSPPPEQGDGGISLMNHISHLLFLFLGVFFFSLLLKINNRWKKAEDEKLSTELSYLKAQVNPHFLFNTLNSIYALALEKSDSTASAVVKLSGMMRYVLNDANKDFVTLDKELNYISDYIDLQKIRYGNVLDLNYCVKGEVNGKQIAPLLLIPFVENAFKYGVNAEEESKIKIEITIQESELEINVINNKVTVQLNDEDKTGVGIANVKNRLQLLYPGKHHLNITDDIKSFSVYLTLNLQ